MHRSRGGCRGSGIPLKNHKNIGFLSNTGPDPLKNHKATKPAFNVGPSSACHWNANSILGHHRPPVKRHLNGVSLASQCWPAFSAIWILSPLWLKKTHKKTSEMDPLWQNFLDPHMILSIFFILKMYMYSCAYSFDIAVSWLLGYSYGLVLIGTCHSL